MATKWKTLQTSSVAKGAEQLNTQILLVSVWIGHSLTEICLTMSTEAKHMYMLWPSNFLPRYIKKKKKKTNDSLSPKTLVHECSPGCIHTEANLKATISHQQWKRQIHFTIFVYFYNWWQETILANFLDMLSDRGVIRRIHVDDLHEIQENVELIYGPILEVRRMKF